MSGFVSDLAERRRDGNAQEWKTEGSASQETCRNVKDGALKADLSYSVFSPIGIHCTSLKCPIHFVKLISSFYCNCDTVMAKTTVISAFTYVVQPWTFNLPENTQGDCCFLCFRSTAVSLENLMIRNSFFQAKGYKGKTLYTFFLHTGCSAEEMDFYTLVLPFRSWG